MSELFKKIAIDGDSYFLTIPECNKLDRLLAYCGKHEIEIDRTDSCFAWKRSKDLSGRDVALLVTNLSAYPVGHDGRSGWRPMLIPLDKNNKPDSYFQDKSGKLVFGGSLACCESGRPSRHIASIGKAWDARPVMPVMDPSLDAPDIVDTRPGETHHIPWMVWEGCLICTRVLIGKINVGKLLRNQSVAGMVLSGPETLLL